MHGVELTRFFSYVVPILSFFMRSTMSLATYIVAHFLLSVIETNKDHGNLHVGIFFRTVFILEMLKYCIFFILLLIHYCSSNEDTYKEELYIRPLPTGHTYFNLLFTTVVSPDILKPNISKLN